MREPDYADSITHSFVWIVIGCVLCMGMYVHLKKFEHSCAGCQTTDAQAVECDEASSE